MHSISFIVNNVSHEHILDAFDECPYSLSCFEEGPDWRIECISDDAHMQESIVQILTRACSNLAIPTPNITKHSIKPRDWVSESQKHCQSFDEGPFTIYPSWDNDHKKQRLPICIDPNQAFGSGHHETTLGCLRLLHTNQVLSPKTILDIGCGSGILSIASKKLWPNTTINAFDIDPIAYDIAKENIKHNQTEINLYTYDEVKTQKGSFDLIVANILMQPILDYANTIKEQTHDQSTIILSGAMVSENQDKAIIEHYKHYGFSLKQTCILGNWASLLLSAH